MFGAVCVAAFMRFWLCRVLSVLACGLVASVLRVLGSGCLAVHLGLVGRAWVRLIFLCFACRGCGLLRSVCACVCSCRIF